MEEEVEAGVAEDVEVEVEVDVAEEEEDEGPAKTTRRKTIMLQQTLHLIQRERRHPLLLPAMQKSSKMAKREPTFTQSMKPIAFVGRKN